VAGGYNLYKYPSAPLTKVDLFGLHPPKDEDDKGPSKTGQDEEEGGPFDKSSPAVNNLGELRKNLRAKTEKRAQEIIDAKNGPDSKNKGPVLTGAVDPKYPDDGPFFGQNTGLPEDPHPVIVKRLNDHNDDIESGKVKPSVKAGEPGDHSEVNALDQALKNRDKRNKEKGLPPATESDVEDIQATNVNLKKNKIPNPDDPDGEPVTVDKGKGCPPRCDHCQGITGPRTNNDGSTSPGITMIGKDGEPIDR